MLSDSYIYEQASTLGVHVGFNVSEIWLPGSCTCTCLFIVQILSSTGLPQRLCFVPFNEKYAECWHAELVMGKHLSWQGIILVVSNIFELCMLNIFELCKSTLNVDASFLSTCF